MFGAEVVLFGGGQSAIPGADVYKRQPNNWVSVQKGQDGKFEAGVGEETFDVELTVSLKDGKILSGQMDNVVKTVERTCCLLYTSRCV